MTNNTAQHLPTPDRLISVHEVLAQVGVGKSKLYQLIRKKEFPAPRKIGHRSGWLESKVQAWIRR